MRRPRAFFPYPKESQPDDWWHVFNVKTQNLNVVGRRRLVMDSIVAFTEDRLDTTLFDIYQTRYRSIDGASNQRRLVEARSQIIQVMSMTEKDVVEHICMWGFQIPETRRELFASRMIREIATELSAQFMQAIEETENEQKTA